jgi:hypothetical protein
MMVRSRLVRVGSYAPALVVRTVRGAVDLAGGSRLVVLAFVAPEAFAATDPAVLAGLRAELRGLGAMLVVVSDDALFSFRPDDDVARLARGDEIRQEDVFRARRALGLDRFGGVLVVDERRVVRFAHAWKERSMSSASGHHELAGLATLRDGLAYAGRMLVKGPLRPLSRREMVASTVVAALALVFVEGCERTPSTTASTSATSGRAALNKLLR